MNLPVRDVGAALPFYETVLGFRVLSRSETPHTSAVLARDQVQIGLAENGGDSTQDGCVFHVKDLESDWPIHVLADPPFRGAVNLEYSYAAFADRRFAAIREAGVKALTDIKKPCP